MFKLNVSSQTAATTTTTTTTTTTRIDGVGHNSSNHSINATHNINNNIRINSLVTTTSTSTTAAPVPVPVPAAAVTQTLFARRTSVNPNTFSSKRSVSGVGANALSSSMVDQVEFNRVTANQSSIDDRPKRLWTNFRG